MKKKKWVGARGLRHHEEFAQFFWVANKCNGNYRLPIGIDIKCLAVEV